MTEELSRTIYILGRECMERLSKSRVVIFGIGGVGSYAAETLARSGTGAIDIVDPDAVCASNINRQLFALHSTIGMYKADVAASRIKDINPECKITIHRIFFSEETCKLFDFSLYDYVIDCIDTVSAKLKIAGISISKRIPIISCMGAGNKIEPSMLQVADIADTSVCPLARVMRRELKKRGILHMKVVYSKEKPMRAAEYAAAGNDSKERRITGSTAFVPAAAGIMIASEVVKDIAGLNSKAISSSV